MSAAGQKQTLERGTEMSASPPRADVGLLSAISRHWDPSCDQESRGNDTLALGLDFGLH